MSMAEFWRALSLGVEVVVASRDSEQLLGVRDGFRRFFHSGLRRDLSVVVKASGSQPAAASLRSSEEEMVSIARRNAVSVRRGDDPAPPFAVGLEEGMVSLEVDGEWHGFVRCWAVVASDVGTAFGSSGSIEIPVEFTDASESAIPAKVPGTRRRGGMIGSLTGGLESRRLAVADATVRALSTLFYGLIEIHPEAARWSD